VKDKASFPILLVDDEEQILFSTSITLRSAGFGSVLTESDSQQVMAILSGREIALVILDLYMPHLPGYELLKEIVDRFPQIPVIIMTAANEVELAVECMKTGAFDYLVKPAETTRLIASVAKAQELLMLRSEITSLREQMLSGKLKNAGAFAQMITRNPRMYGAFQYLEAVAASPQPVLISGETGVGKELAARAVHELSGRKGKFIAINIAGLDDMVVSDTLFGHRRGAYTGADRDREGLVAQAAGGTLFLDEIGDMELASQVKLLRLLQEQEYYPLGSDSPRRADVRIVAASNRNLQQMVTDNSFRRDLFYRIGTHSVTIPPLRDRREDLPLLLDFFLEEAATSLGKRKPTPPPELCSYLATYDFPGNIRELRAMVYDAVAQHESKMLSLDSFRQAIQHVRTLQQSTPLAFLGDQDPCTPPIGRMPTLQEAEETLIAHALERAGGNQGIAATYLGISRQALNKRLSRKAVA